MNTEHPYWKRGGIAKRFNNVASGIIYIIISIFDPVRAEVAMYSALKDQFEKSSK